MIFGAVILALLVFFIGRRIGEAAEWRRQFMPDGDPDKLAGHMKMRREVGESDRRLARRLRRELSVRPPFERNIIALRTRVL